MKKIHILESQIDLDYSPCAGTDNPCFYDKKSDTWYEASWNGDYGFPFGYWPVDYSGYEMMFCVGDAWTTHANACGKAAERYFTNTKSEEIQEDAYNLEEKLSELVSDMRAYGYTYNEETDTYVSEDGSDEFCLDDKINEIEDGIYNIDYEYIRELVEYAIEHLEHHSASEIEEHELASYGNGYDFTTKEGIDEAMEALGSDFYTYFESGHNEGRIWPRNGMIGFYTTEQPDPDTLNGILRDLSQNDDIGVTYEQLLDFFIIFEDGNNNWETTGCTVLDYMNGDYGPDYDDDEYDNDEEETESEMQYARPEKTVFIPHLANQQQKREYFQDFRNTRDRAVYAPRERAAGSLARYHTMRYPYGENREHKKIHILESQMESVINRKDDSERYNHCGFEMLIGIPGSGKSTYLKRINNPNIEIVCPDDIRREICGNISDQSRNREVWEMAEMLIMKYLSRGKYVILDATNVNTRSRQQLLSRVKATNSGVKTYATMFDANPKVSKERIAMDIKNKVDRSNVPPEVIDRMYNMYQDTVKIIDTEGFDKVYYA